MIVLVDNTLQRWKRRHTLNNTPKCVQRFFCVPNSVTRELVCEGLGDVQWCGLGVCVVDELVIGFGGACLSFGILLWRHPLGNSIVQPVEHCLLFGVVGVVGLVSLIERLHL